MLALVFLTVVCCFEIGSAQLINRTCKWSQPRAAVIRDTFYLDGGDIWDASFDPSTGQYIQSTAATSNLTGSGIIFKLYFNSSFSISDGFEDIFVNDYGAGGINDNPPFRSGVMFADDYEYYTFGGISIGSEGRDADLSNYEIYKPDGPMPQTIPSWRGGCNTHYTPQPQDAKISKNITHGAGVNIPSEYLGFYFSGVQTPNGSYIQDWFNTDTATTSSGGMIKVDMSFMGDAQWSNMSSATAAGIPDRGGAAFSWVPFGVKGLLVLTGGVPNPLGVENNETISSSPTNLMEQVSIYDVANDAWYSQSTSGGPPPQLAEFCAVVAHEEGADSYQIYIYGGFTNDGTTVVLSTSVWVLSIPSFHWTEFKVPTVGRYGHACAMPYPDQMFIVGGAGLSESPFFPNGEIIQVLNLSSLLLLDAYDPRKWSPYQIPDVIKSSAPGQKPAVMDTTLANLFETSQSNTGTPWYPYGVRSSGKNHWLAPVLGGVLGGVALAIAGFLIWFFRHRKSNRSKRASSSSQPTISETQISTPRDGVDAWRQQVKPTSSVMEIDSSDRSTVNNERPPEPVEIGGRTRPYSSVITRSPDFSAAGAPPQSPNSGSVEVSGDPSFRQELQDTSLQQRPSDQLLPMTENPDYRFRNHPLFPLNVNKAKSESAVTSAQAQVSSVDDNEGVVSGTVMHDRAVLSEMDDINHVLYGRPVPPVPPKQRNGSLSDAAHLRHQPSTGRMPYEDIYPGDALPSPVANELSSSPYATFRGSRSFQVMALDTGTESPLPHGVTPVTQSHPGLHQRNTSDQSTATIQLPSPGYPQPPSPDPAEENRRSAYIEQMPDHPPFQRGDPSGTWPQQPHAPWRAAPGTHIRASPPPNAASVKRKEVGSPVRSAYEENKSRFRG